MGLLVILSLAAICGGLVLDVVAWFARFLILIGVIGLVVVAHSVYLLM